MKPNHVPAAGEAMPKSNAEPLVTVINTFRKAWAKHMTIEDEDKADAASHLWEAPKAALAAWTGPAVSHDEAIAALRLAVDEIRYDGSEIVGPMVKAALGYFDNLAHTNNVALMRADDALAVAVRFGTVLFMAAHDPSFDADARDVTHTMCDAMSERIAEARAVITEARSAV